MQYFLKNETKIVSELRKKDNELLFKKFYHLRWFQISPWQKDRESLQRLHKSLLQPTYASFGPEQALKLLIHLFTCVGKVLEEFSNFAEQILDQIAQVRSKKKEEGADNEERYEALLKTYVQFWNNY